MHKGLACNVQSVFQTIILQNEKRGKSFTLCTNPNVELSFFAYLTWFLVFENLRLNFV